MLCILWEDRLQPIAAGFWTVFKYFRSKATGNPTNHKSGQPRPMVWLHSVGFSLVAVIFSVHPTGPLNTTHRLLNSLWYVPNAFWLSALHEVSSTHPPVFPWIFSFNSCFAWTARTLLPVHFLIPLNFSDDSLVLLYVWNQVYMPCWKMSCSKPLIKYFQIYELTIFLNSLSSLDHWGFFSSFCHKPSDQFCSIVNDLPLTIVPFWLLGSSNLPL